MSCRAGVRLSRFLHVCECPRCRASVMHGYDDAKALIEEVRLDPHVVIHDQALEDALHRLGHSTFDIWGSEAHRRDYSPGASPGYEGALCDMTYQRVVLADHQCGEQQK